MRTKGFFRKGLIVTVVSSLLLIALETGICAPSKVVAVLPFTMNSPQDLGFLQNGLFTMLSSRLESPGKVRVLDRDTVNAALVKAEQSGLNTKIMTEDKARKIGADMGGDFVLFGSLTHFGESVSLDAKMVDVTGQKETISFFEQSNAMGDVIPLVNSFAGEINEQVFDRHIDNALYTKRQAPEKSKVRGGLEPVEDEGDRDGGMEDVQNNRGFSTHLKVGTIIRAMAVGDLNKDGVQQVVAASDSKLMVFHFEGKQLILENTLEYDSFLRIVGLDIADINGNGFPEIFVSATTIHRDNLASFVVEYNGGGYHTLVDGVARYYRVITRKNQAKVLLTQEKGKDPYSGDVYEMAPAGGGTYREVKELDLPRDISVRSLAQGAISSEEGEELLGINRHNRLILMNTAGHTEWSSTKKYGKSNNYWLMPAQDADTTYRERSYFNPRVDLYTPEGEGLAKAFVVKNREVGGGALGRIKHFEEGRIEIMGWNGIALKPISQTGKLQGWVSDYALMDINGDGRDELLVTVVSRTKMFILSKDNATNIISYKLDL